jgi:DNA-binding MarR family transcriptional regulator
MPDNSDTVLSLPVAIPFSVAASSSPAVSSPVIRPLPPHPGLTVELTTCTVVNMSERLTTQTRPLPEPDADLGYLFRLAHQRFRALLDSELEDLGLSAQEYGILSVFQTRPELSTAELARISQVTRQTMHTSVLSLEAAGLVERSARNQRVVLVRPTTRGRQRLQTATRRVRAVEHAALADLGREDERTVRAWLASLAALTTGPEKAGAEQKETS